MFDRVKHLISIAPQILEEDIIEMDSKNCLKIIKEPVGLALLISPWNYPLLTSASAIVPAILCGNPVLLKHSPKTALCGEMFENSFKNTGATNVLQSVFFKNDDIRRIIKSYQVGYVGFVGSTETGKTVLKNIANESRFLNSSFELGGKDAAYVRRDADIDFAVENLVI
jgi:acyl-CoA reductase-like NAD-dependent aldehyde dehydrogenase